MVFKSRLDIEHWTYIFDDMNKASRKTYEDGSLKTVNSSTAIDRLEAMCNYSFENTQKDDLRKLRDARNRFEHGFINNHPKAIESIINKAVEVVVDFLGKNYEEFEIPSNMSEDNEGLTDREKANYKTLTVLTKELKNHHDDAVKLALARALSVTLEEDLIECPECGEKLLRHGDDETACECFFCGYSENSQIVAKKYIENILHISEYEIGHHGGEFPLCECPECGCESMVKTGDEYICFSCGIKYDLDELRECTLCGKLFYPIEDEFDCNECMQRIQDAN